MDEFERHQGSVTSVVFSSVHDTFVSSGTDKEIRIYNLLHVSGSNFKFSNTGKDDCLKKINFKSLFQYNCQHVIGVEDTAIGLSWLIGNTDIFAAYGAGQTVAFYNFKNGKTVPDLLLETNGTETSSLQFNTQRYRIRF